MVTAASTMKTAAARTKYRFFMVLIFRSFRLLAPVYTRRPVSDTAPASSKLRNRGDDMRIFPIALVMAAASLYAQTPAKSSPSRMPDGKPNLTGVWQGNSTRRGSWEEANTGLGVGGTGRDTSAPANATAQQTGGMAPYQPWAAKKVLESFNKRGVDDPTAFCLPPGLPRLTLTGLFPIQIIHTADQVAFLYEYMNVFRVVPLNGKHNPDAVPTY